MYLTLCLPSSLHQQSVAAWSLLALLQFNLDFPVLMGPAGQRVLVAVNVSGITGTPTPEAALTGAYPSQTVIFRRVPARQHAESCPITCSTLGRLSAGSCLGKSTKFVGQ